MQPGNIVRFRNRDWVYLPGEDEEIIRLRPLTGVLDEVVEVHRTLSGYLGYSLSEERITASFFPPPSPSDISDLAGARLLWQAARLVLREGASPLRCLGRISVRPRAYQFVPLLMALRLDPVRIFIADDVGVGKTVEALLIARELFDRGEIRRLAVLCPPYLCDQWERELRGKFNLDPVVIRSGTIGALERRKPLNRSIYEYFPVQVISIDWVKSDRNRHRFIRYCPELVIVDEVHGASETESRSKGRQQRHRLLVEIAGDPKRHLILLTATPHSGVETAFRSLLGLIDPEFREWDVGNLDEARRIRLARHFVQRTRRDIERTWEAERCFPVRVSVDETYSLSPAYRDLFSETYKFCREIVRSGRSMAEQKRRVRYWGALALLRCVMSSPAAAATALRKRSAAAPVPEEDADFSAFVLDPEGVFPADETPVSPVEEVKSDLTEADHRRLRRLAAAASALYGSGDDGKFERCAAVIETLLSEGFHPIVWCRYVATAGYVADGLRNRLKPHVQVICVTGRIGDEERRMKIDELRMDRPRVLVATDCLSEGINLQEMFTAVLHYDLPWNPNRLEQREGRVDRYGQTAETVKAVRFYGRDNPMDGAVIDVLLNKAREIHRVLGTYVPVPEESETVMEAVFNSLFLRDREVYGQLRLFDHDEELMLLHARWDRQAERERINRTRFAQRAVKPEDVIRELDAADRILGDPAAVRTFLLTAAQRIGLKILKDRKRPDAFTVDVSEQALATIPDAVRLALPPVKDGRWPVSFVSPAPAGAEYIGRNHPFTAATARYVFESALAASNDAPANRCGVARTRAVTELTVLLLLRARYLLQFPERAPLLAEETRVTGYRPADFETIEWLDDDTALDLLENAQPAGNVPDAEKRELAVMILDHLRLRTDTAGPPNEDHPVFRALSDRLQLRASELRDSHKRIRKAVSLRVRALNVKPQLPPDILGVLVLQPVAEP